MLRGMLCSDWVAFKWPLPKLTPEVLAVARNDSGVSQRERQDQVNNALSQRKREMADVYSKVCTFAVVQEALLTLLTSHFITTHGYHLLPHDKDHTERGIDVLHIHRASLFPKWIVSCTEPGVVSPPASSF